MAWRIGTGLSAAFVVATLGVPIGLLWTLIAPRTTTMIIAGKALLADPETQTLIAADGWFAGVTGLAGLCCGVVGYILAGRIGEVQVLGAIAAGGAGAAVIAWRIGHQVGLSGFHHFMRTAKDGATVGAPLNLQAHGMLIAWPLAAVAVFSLLEALDIAGRERRRRLAAGDVGGARAGQPNQVGGFQFDLQAAPTGRDVDGRER